MPKPTFPKPSTPSKKTIDKAVQQINAVHDRVLRAGLAGTTEIGRIVFEMAYGGDEALFRSHDPGKAIGLRRLAERADLLLPGDPIKKAQSLGRAISIYLTYRRLPEPAKPRLLECHIETLSAVKDETLRAQLAERAAAESPTDRVFREVVREAREAHGETVRRAVRAPGQPRTTSTPTPVREAEPVATAEGTTGVTAEVPSAVTAEVPMSNAPAANDDHWHSLAARLLDDQAGRAALDAVLAQRGLMIIPKAEANEPDLDALADVLVPPSVEATPETSEARGADTAVEAPAKAPPKPRKAAKAKKAPESATTAPKVTKRASKAAMATHPPEPQPTPENPIHDLFGVANNDGGSGDTNKATAQEPDEARGAAVVGEEGEDGGGEEGVEVGR